MYSIIWSELRQTSSRPALKHKVDESGQLGANIVLETQAPENGYDSGTNISMAGRSNPLQNQDPSAPERPEF